MKKVLLIILSTLFPLFIASPVFADTSSPVIGHPGYFIRHGSAVVQGSAADASSNWSGYAVSGANGAYNTVTSNWTQPTLNCAELLNKSAYSAYWVGLDGFNDQTVEQIGTEGNCVNNQASYYAWYEMYPQNPYELSVNLPVTPGDEYTATVSYTPPSTHTVTVGRGRFAYSYKQTTNASYTLTLNNDTLTKSFSTTISSRQTYNRSSAEVIVEAPYSNGILPLADYVTTSFTGSEVNGLPMGSSANLQDIIMDNPAGMVSTPSAFDATNQNFSTTWSDPAL